MDFSKAFDTLNHRKLLEALQSIGIRGLMADWMAEYLCNRKFCVKICNEYSEAKIIEYGVPQGSKLGPFLFILYTSELLRVFKSSIPFAFADDTAIVVRHRDIDAASRTIQEEFEAAVRWCHENGLVINASKTKLMHIRNPHFKLTDNLIYFQNESCNSTSKEQIEIVESYKYLGIVIDSRFLWVKHVGKLCSDLRKGLNALSHLKYHASDQVLRQVYYALIESKIRYGILAWGTASKTHINKNQRLQNSALKIIQNCTRRQNQGNFKVLKVEEIYKMTAMLEYQDDNRFNPLIEHQINTRQRAQGLYRIPRYFNIYGKRQLNYMVPTINNSLPQSIKAIRNYKTRKKQLKHFFLNS